MNLKSKNLLGSKSNSALQQAKSNPIKFDLMLRIEFTESGEKYYKYPPSRSITAFFILLLSGETWE
jgi:hypothetical protein